MNGYPDSPRWVLRPATPDDILSLTELHLASFGPRDHLPVILGRDFVQATYRWLLNGRGCDCLVADLDGRIVGSAGVSQGSYTRPMFLACLPQLIRSLLRRPRLILEKPLWERVFRHAAVTEIGRRFARQTRISHITVVVVDPGYRGLGVFQSLIPAVVARSEERGSRAIQSGVYKFNEPSRRAFIKAGWLETPALETHDTVFFLYYLDPHLPTELGVSQSLSDGAMKNER